MKNFQLQRWLRGLSSSAKFESKRVREYESSRVRGFESLGFGSLRIHFLFIRSLQFSNSHYLYLKNKKPLIAERFDFYFTRF